MSVKNKFINEENIKTQLKKFGIENAEIEIENISKQINSIINSYKPKNKIAREQYEKGKPFFEVYKTAAELNLPEWVLSKIETAKVIGNSYQTIIFPNGEKYQINNSLNNLSATDWLLFTKSVFEIFYSANGKDSYAHEIRKIHPSPKPPQLMKEIIEFFTKKGELVFDYFMGVGGTLLGAGLCGRKAAGIELNQKYIEAYKAAAEKIDVKAFPVKCGDCIEILNSKTEMSGLLKEQKISLVLIDPPYANMMSKKKTGADIEVYGNVATPFTDDSRDFGNFSAEVFFHNLKKSVELVLPYVKKRGYVVVFIKDLQPEKKETNLLHARIIEKLNEIPEVNYKGLKILADKSTKLFPYGYPFSFVSNQIHQFILIFRKEK